MNGLGFGVNVGSELLLLKFGLGGVRAPPLNGGMIGADFAFDGDGILFAYTSPCFIHTCVQLFHMYRIKSLAELKHWPWLERLQDRLVC